MDSRLDPAFGALGVGAPGWYLYGGMIFRVSRVAVFFILSFAFRKCICLFVFSSRIVPKINSKFMDLQIVSEC